MAEHLTTTDGAAGLDVIGRELRLVLGARPMLLDSALPAAQAACEGWHAGLPTHGAVTVDRAVTWREFVAMASAHRGVDPDGMSVFSPRQLQAGMACQCGWAGNSAAAGQVGRVACGRCGQVGGAPASVSHVLPLSALAGAGAIAGVGLPSADLVWTYADHDPEAAWVPWALGAAPVPGRRPLIGVLGVGALGFRVAELLARQRYALALVDLDTVEAKNLGTSYGLADVGRPKVEAASDWLRGLDGGVAVRSYPGDLRQDLGLGVLAQWDAAVLCLDNVAAKVAASGFLELLGVPYLQAQVDAASATAMVRGFRPGQTCCATCLLTAHELTYEAHYGCTRQRGANTHEGPRLFTTAVETAAGAALVAAAVRHLAPLEVAEPGPQRTVKEASDGR